MSTRPSAIIASAGGDRITDVDSGETVTASLTLADPTAGALTTSGTATYTAGTGLWTLTDTVANVNLALANLVFTPNTDNDVDTSIDVVIDDVEVLNGLAARGELDIADTWHLYDHAYAEDPESFFIGVDLMPGEGANLAGFQAKFPKGEEGEFMGEKVVMLHHHADIEVTIKLPADASGTVELPFVLSAQACDDKICLQPSDVAVVANITVE